MEHRFNREERDKIRDTEPLKGFIKKYNSAIYDAIESESGVISKHVQMKKGGLRGYVICLWMPLDDSVFRKRHLWYVKWETGKFGIIDENDIVRCLNPYSTYGELGHWCDVCEYGEKCKLV